ncbi:cytochrome P450 [Streptomyces sp. NBRC 109706]|uniref:cytochrome P450 family protein n=1 Tax=Streptomyces sp. NBRC 109706 TaxID=1550035 RepID=UPI000784F7DA|nr:cytochrome P450 [Streptomyces sp. NBRC 109706]
MTAPTQDSQFFQDPYPMYAKLRTEAPVQLGPIRSEGRRRYLVLGYDEARQALADPRLSKDPAPFFADQPPRDIHPAVSRSMLATDPPAHTRLRKLVAKAFTTGAVTRLLPRITELTHELLDRWPLDGEVDFVESLATPLPVTVICELLGVPTDDRPTLQRWSADLFAAGDPARHDAASHQVADYTADLITTKRSHPGDDLLDHLIATRDNGDHLNEDELVSLAVLLLIAGHETTTNFLGNALLALLQHPQALTHLRDHPDQIPHALDELLRYDGPINTATFRHTTHDIPLGDTTIPAGTAVLISPAAANHDPQRFPHPDQLDLTRDPTGHLAFGHGIHRCLGAPLAKAEADIALTTTLTRFPNLRLAIPPDQLHWRHTRLTRGLTTLPLHT